MAYTYIDDSDPRVQYSSGWGIAGISEEYDGTTHWTAQGGVNATLVFSGTGIAVYGTVGPGKSTTSPKTLFSVDSVAQVTYSASPVINAIQYNVQFFSSQSLQNGQHTIVVTNLRNCSPSFFLDYFVVQSSSPSSSLSIVPTTSQVVSSAMATATTSSTTTNTGSSSTSIIVGAVLGSFIFISAIIFIVWLVRRRLRHKSNSQSSVAPFLRPPPHLSDLQGSSTISRVYDSDPATSHPWLGVQLPTTFGSGTKRSDSIEGQQGLGSPIDAPPSYSGLTSL